MASKPYFLKSQRLGFRCWSRDDLPLARDLWGDLEVTKFFGGPFTETEIQRRLQVELDRAAAHNFQYWPIHLLADDEFVGCCGLRPYKAEEGIPELGFHLRPKFWGRGLAPEAAKATIDYAFRALNCKGLSAGHHPENVNSSKVLEKLGFQYTHDEFFPALGMHIPYYLLAGPAGSVPSINGGAEPA
jgi:[ribosomal protein S5]-alanine N-acetyltransferase